MPDELRKFLDEFENYFRKLYVRNSTAYWNASINGSKENWDEVTKTQVDLIKLFREKKYFQIIQRFYNDYQNLDPLAKRQVSILYNEFLPNQYDLDKLEEITRIQNKIENVFSTFRAEYNESVLTDNEVDEFLKRETDSKILKEVWESSKKIGDLISDDILQLVKLRNDQARTLGFKNYHDMSLILSELIPEELDLFFSTLDQETTTRYSEIKNLIDSDLSKRYKINIEDLMPWHFQGRFFQEAPAIYAVNFDKFYLNKDLIDLTRNYFKSIGLPIDDLLNRSDLFERENKNQHAFCINLDRSGDVRVLSNVKPNVDWMGTLLHEFGHAVYDKFINPDFPFVLRDIAHTFVTEAIAQLFGKLAVHPIWIKVVFSLDSNKLNDVKQPAIFYTKINQIIFARWVFVMYHFEKTLYENPDNDLNSHWWDLHNKYLLLNKPENRNKPDWATKIHIATSPCYYHNYLLGEVFSSQLNYKLYREILMNENLWEDVLINRTEIGEYLIEKLFRFGASLHWKDVVKISSGEDLNTKYYLNQYLT